MTAKEFELITDPLHLKKAPIREAILQIRFQTDEGFDASSIAKLEADLPDHLSVFSKKYAANIAFQLDLESENTPVLHPSSKELRGYVASNEEKTRIAVFEDNSFTFSMLPPYTDWSSFKTEAKQLWDIYTKHLPKISFRRAALRYINELPIPIGAEGLDFDEYLTTGPKFPEEMGNTVGAFLGRIEIVLESIDVHVMAIQSCEELAKDGCIKVILDNDVYRESIGDFTESDLWTLFDKLRDVKNTMFFKSLTEKALRHFQ